MSDMPQELRSFLDQVAQEHPEQLFRVSEPVDPVYDVTALVMALEKHPDCPILHLDQVAGSDFPLVANVLATQALIANFDRLLKKSGDARVIGLTSNVVRNPRAYWGAYAASKAALEESLRGWRVEHPDWSPDAEWEPLVTSTCVTVLRESVSQSQSNSGKSSGCGAITVTPDPSCEGDAQSLALAFTGGFEADQLAPRPFLRFLRSGHQRLNCSRAPRLTWIAAPVGWPAPEGKSSSRRPASTSPAGPSDARESVSARSLPMALRTAPWLPVNPTTRMACESTVYSAS